MKVQLAVRAGWPPFVAADPPARRCGCTIGTMSRARRLLVVAAAWAIPAVWILGALLAGPSDGTVVSSSLLTAPASGDPAS